MRARTARLKTTARKSTRAQNIPPSSPRKSCSDAPLISIVTAVHNGSDKIEKTMASVSGQDYERVQYIVIDAGSTDGTLDVIRAHEKEIGYWISEPDRGISNAFNKGIARARGDLIGILNAGDWYEPNALSTIAEVYQSHPDVDVFCGSIRFWDHNSPVLHCYSNPELLERQTSVYHPTVFIKRAAYEKYGVYDQSYRYAMDYELLLRFKRRGAKFFTLEQVLANMTLDGISSENWYSGLQEVWKARSMYFPRYNVLYYHTLAVLKNLIARALKKGGLQSVYQAYWRARNRRVASGPEREG